MKPTDLLLIALVPTPDDLVRAQAGWYRIPESAAPALLWEVQALAFYQPRSFGERGLEVAWWGRVKEIERQIRRDLIPTEPEHRRADEMYLRVALEPLTPRDPPLRAKKARRLLFVPVRWGAFRGAASLDDLFPPPQRPVVDSLLYRLIHPQLEGAGGINPPDEENRRLFEDEEELIPDW